MQIDTDPRNTDFSMKIPEITKFEIDKLTKLQRAKMNDEILVTMARIIHDSKFNPCIYLKTIRD